MPDHPCPDRTIDCQLARKLILQEPIHYAIVAGWKRSEAMGAIAYPRRPTCRTDWSTDFPGESIDELTNLKVLADGIVKVSAWFKIPSRPHLASRRLISRGRWPLPGKVPREGPQTM
jgi:hypothetical protein